MQSFYISDFKNLISGVLSIVRSRFTTCEFHLETLLSSLQEDNCLTIAETNLVYSRHDRKEKITVKDWNAQFFLSFISL